MDSFGKILGNYVIRNDNDISLFKVIFYENGISFDNKFLKGIIDNENTHRGYKNINKSWASKKKTKEDIIDRIMNLLQENQEYLSQFFYEESELDEKGDVIEDMISSSVKSTTNKYSVYLSYLKNSGKLNEITRKDFESKIVDKEIGDFYVENFDKAKNEAEFYTYKSEVGDDSYIMVVEDSIKIGFAAK